MRNKLFILPLMLILVSCNGGHKADSNVEKTINIDENSTSLISFVNKINDLGSINEGEKVIGWYDYKNEGTAPLIIHSIKAGCGCTVPKWNKEPLPSGEKATIKVVFDSAGKHGVQDISIYVRSNAENSREELRLQAKVNNN